ncbi:MAG TPA: DUF1707 domain-containing protein [Acidimicrobiales bacterium]|nr:DUF1707 domain-containing protein [Acidimicrobiales bacterium]
MPPGSLSVSSGSDPSRRVSDADRDRTARMLNEGLAKGFLTPEEHSERLDAALAARFASELAPLSADLPASRDLAALRSTPVSQRVNSMCSKVVRRVEPGPATHVRASARFGQILLDLRHLPPDGDPVVLTANCFAGQIKLVLPPGAQVVDVGTSRFGQRVVGGGGSGQGPVIYLRGRTQFGQLKCIASDRFWKSWKWKGALGA